MLTILTALTIYFLSHDLSLLLDLASRAQNNIFIMFVEGIQLLFPPFEALNIKDVIGSFTNFHANYFILNTFYSIAYLGIILFFTIIIFNKKKFEN
jgi:hypothetical protein